jgi:hypothetical protein
MMRLMPLVVLVLMMVANTLYAAKLYRWVDENGKVFYSDKVPPSQAQHERKTLDQRGMVVETTGRAKTPEEAAREAELERRRQEQKRLVEQQKQEDDLLLSTFQNEDDIILTRDGKLKAVDARIKILRTSLRYSQQRLARLKSQAGAKPKDKQKKELDALESQIKRYYGDVINLEQQKQDIRTTYAEDLSRFRQLKNPRGHKAQVQETTQQAVSTGVALENLLVCDSNCPVIWGKVKDFVRKNADTAVEISGDSIIVTKVPATDSEIALTVSRNKKGAGREEFFLDLQCKSTVAGQQYCRGEKAGQILQGFRALR